MSFINANKKESNEKYRNYQNELLNEVSKRN